MNVAGPWQRARRSIIDRATRPLPHPRLILAVVVLYLVGVVGNPMLVTPASRSRATWALELVTVALVGAASLVRAAKRDDSNPIPSEGPTDRIGWLMTFALLAFTFCLWLHLFRERWQHPRLFADDAHYLSAARDWPTTRANLFVPYNEHMVAPARLVTYLCVRSGPAESLPWRMARVAVPLWAVAIVLIFLLGQRTTGSRTAGLFAAITFGLSATYQETVVWYSATLWFFPLLILLGCLLAVTRRNPIGWQRIGIASAGSFVATYCYSLGMVVGPLVALWILVKRPPNSCPHRIRTALLPLFGTMLGVLSYLPAMLTWFATDEYRASGGRAMVETFDPLGGALYSIRLFVDRLVLHNLGFNRPLSVMETDDWPYWIAFATVATVGVWLLNRRPAQWRLLPEAAMIALPYALTMPFRTWVDYSTMLNWTRYQLIPQAGWSLFLAGLFASLGPRWFADGSLRRTVFQAMGLAILAVLLWWLHLDMVAQPPYLGRSQEVSLQPIVSPS